MNEVYMFKKDTDKKDDTPIFVAAIEWLKEAGGTIHCQGTFNISLFRLPKNVHLNGGNFISR